MVVAIERYLGAVDLDLEAFFGRLDAIQQQPQQLQQQQPKKGGKAGKGDQGAKNRAAVMLEQSNEAHAKDMLWHVLAACWSAVPAISDLSVQDTCDLLVLSSRLTVATRSDEWHTQLSLKRSVVKVAAALGKAADDGVALDHRACGQVSGAAPAWLRFCRADACHLG